VQRWQIGLKARATWSEDDWRLELDCGVNKQEVALELVRHIE